MIRRLSANNRSNTEIPTILARLT